MSLAMHRAMPGARATRPCLLASGREANRAKSRRRCALTGATRRPISAKLPHPARGPGGPELRNYFAPPPGAVPVIAFERRRSSPAIDFAGLMMLPSALRQILEPVACTHSVAACPVSATSLGAGAAQPDIMTTTAAIAPPRRSKRMCKYLFFELMKTRIVAEKNILSPAQPRSRRPEPRASLPARHARCVQVDVVAVSTGPCTLCPVQCRGGAAQWQR
jgi:hypothetical protein